MKISLQYMDQLQGITDWNQAKGFVRQQFEDLAAQISHGWNAEHNTDGTHNKATVTSDVVASGSVTAARGLGTFGGQHRCFMKAAAHTINNTSEDILAWQTPVTDGAADGFPDTGWNVGGMFDPSTPTRVTCKVAGNYLINWSIQLAFGTVLTGGYTFLSTGGYGSVADFAQEGFATNVTSAGCLVLPMIIGQFFTISASQTSGGNVAMQISFMRSWLQCTRIS